MKILLVQPDAETAEAVAAEFAEVGYEVVLATEDVAGTLAAVGDVRPSLVVVCLDRDPRRALAWASGVLSRRALRTAPVLFAGGTEEALAAAEQAHPRASFTRMEALQTSIASLHR